MTYSERIVRLMLEGRHAEAEALAARVVDLYREDPSGDGSKDDGKCNDCGKVFVEGDCQHAELEPFILCDRCYLNRGGR